MGNNKELEKDNTRKRNEKAYYNAKHSEEIDKCRHTFTEHLKEARKAKNLTQEEVAKKLDISPSTYRKYEQKSGNRTDTAYFIKSLVDTFEVSADYLIGKSNTPHPEYDDVIKKTGLNDKAIQQLQKFYALDGSETSQGYLDFINCFLGNDECTSLFFQLIAPLLRNLNEAMSTSERMTTVLSTQLADYLYDYITKVVVPTYVQLYWTGEYTPVDVEKYMPDKAVTNQK